MEAVKRLEIKGKATYAGRLDPMAEGELLILTDEDIADKDKYLGLDKEYEATFLLGVSTDTGDFLGLISLTSNVIRKSMTLDVREAVEGLRGVKEQIYPWFSSKTVGGIPLFEYYKKGNTDIKRPSRKVQIKKITPVGPVQGISKEKLEKYIFDSINLVKGDFRQEEVLNKWSVFFDETKQKEFVIVKVKLKVSSGTYIRGLTENLAESLGVPVVLMRLKRTKIFLEN